ncbi:MAG: hypothetical protein OQK01_13305 [Xanthomonadales bacterium]|jgi:hypothetical protein|nr:hypothetical protein [Xanthomonadales bacterium]
MDTRVSTIYFLTRRLGAWLLAVAVAYVLASATATQSVIGSLAGMGVDVQPGVRLQMTLSDIVGMANMFLPMVAFALLMAFMTAALLCRWLARWRLPLYAVAGGAALITIHLILHLAFGLTPIAIARTAGGLLLQGLAGATGGVCYLLLIRRQAIEDW